ncbi:predicted protein [Plenodomus lingam JN3]|uniref:Predicted protein n=1 Tax=Leptosphaeria maculans (strain JN3 / isolate v23.1.3 / race Av1-4-5-6-7-8) TaxID=985895 RepID=E4ZX04_LEPMJ|nr:predicted protein [Plenodomus lingam JN3]CBX95214.1 predicted protein [Plenodomus lingam JN3]
MPEPTVYQLKVKLAVAEQELKILQQHHAECDIKHNSLKPIFHSAPRTQKRPWTEPDYNDIDITFKKQAPKRVNIHRLCTNATLAMKELKCRATDLVSMKKTGYYSIELFRYLSCVTAGHALGRFNGDEANQLVQLVLVSATSYDYLLRIRNSVEWLHSKVIGKLVKSGWKLEMATAVVAEYAPTTASGLRHLKDNGDQDNEYMSKFEAIKASLDIGSFPFWSVPSQIAKWNPEISLDHVCTALRYLTTKQGRLFSLLHVCTLNALDATLVHYESLGLVEIRNSSVPGETLIVSRVKAANEAYDTDQAVILSCFFFTGCCEYVSNVRQHSLRALPLFRQLVNNHKQDNKPFLVSTMMRALLQASKFSDNEWKSQSIAIASKLVPEGININDRAYLAYRRSFVLRAKGDLNEAKSVIEEYWKSVNPGVPVDPLLHSIHGLLINSRSWIHIAETEFEEAITVCTRWEATNSSLYQMRVERKLATVTGIASKHIGRYDIAIESLRLGLIDDTSRTRSYVLANLCDAYCENKAPQLAYDMLWEEVEGLRALTTANELEALEDTYHRSLLLSFSEVCCYLERYQESDDILWQLRRYFERGGACIARNDQQRHVRTLILLAQSYHRRAHDTTGWSYTLDLWHTLVRWVSRYEVLSTSGWDYAAICLSLHCAHQKIPGNETDIEWLQKASVILLSPKVDHFWMRSMPSFWLDYILQQNSSISSQLRASIISHASLGS